MAHTTIVFDFGGVLLDWNPEYLFAKLIPDVEERKAFLREVCAQDWNEQMDAGKPWHTGVAERTDLFPDKRELIAAFFDRWEEMVRGPIPGMFELHGRLRKAGVPMYGLTNFAAETMEIALERWPILGDFDGVVVSAHEGVIKPDPAIYNILFTRYGLKPEECIFIDDRADNIATARKLGMGGIVFRDAGQCMAELAVLMPDLPANVLTGESA